jgi:hypothetical protein
MQGETKMIRNLKFVWAGLIVVLLIGGCGSMSEKFDPVAERPVVEQVIKNSITWAMNKDTELLYGSFINDSTLFYFSPDNAGTISGFDAFTKLTEEVFMNPAFKAVGSDFKDMRVTFSNSGECGGRATSTTLTNGTAGRPTGRMFAGRVCSRKSTVSGKYVRCTFPMLLRISGTPETRSSITGD